MTKPLGVHAVHGFVYTGLAQIAKILLQIAMTVIVARLVLPDEYGVVAMASPITGFILVFQNLGLNQAAVQAERLDPAHSNALFWYNIIASVVIGLVLVAIAPAVVWFYNDVRPGLVVAASSLTVFCSGVALQHSALLNRQMRFRALSFADVLTMVALVVFTVAFAAAWGNYWALWAGTFASTLFHSILLWRLQEWRPSTTIDFQGTRKLLTFGANVAGFNLLNFVSRNIDNVLVAKVWGSADVGLYDRSYKLTVFPVQSINQPLARVMLPVLARLRNDKARYRDTFIFAIRVISLISVPGFMAAAMCSDRLIPFLLGERWSAAAPIFFWLSLAAVTQPISNATGWLFLTNDRAGELMKWGLFSTPVLIAAFLIGLPWGASGVAAAYFISQVVRIPILYVWCTRGTPLHAWDLYACMLPTIAGGAAAWSIVRMLDERWSTVSVLAISLALSYLFSAAAQSLSAEGRRTLVRSFTLVRSLFKDANV